MPNIKLVILCPTWRLPPGGYRRLSNVYMAQMRAKTPYLVVTIL